MCGANNEVKWESQMEVQLSNSMQNRKVRWCAFRCLVTVLSVTLVGCGANRENMVKSGRITLQKQATGKVDIAWCDAYEDDDGLLVTGVLRRRDTVGTAIKARVDAAVISPDGKKLDEGSSSIISVPRRKTGRLYQSLKRFTVRLSKVPPRGSLVRLVAVSGVS